MKGIKEPLKFYYCSDEIKETQEQPLAANIIKAGTKAIVKITIQNPEIGEGIIPDIEFPKKVYLSKAVVKVNLSNNKALVTFLNASNDNYFDNILPYRLRQFLDNVMIPANSGCTRNKLELVFHN